MLFFSCHLDGTAVCLAEPGGGWDISRGSDLRVNRRDVECWMPLMRVLGLLWAVVLLLSCRCIPLLGGVASESMVSVFYAPDANVGTLMGGCLDVVVPAASLPSALMRRSLWSLCSLPHDAGVGILEPVGGCLDVVVPAVSLPSASSCRSR